MKRMNFSIIAGVLSAAQGATVQPEDTGEALVNPGMGWTMQFYSNVPENYGSKLEPSDTLDDFPGLSTVYLRIPWAFIEPEEGVYNWAILDTPAQRWIAKGKRIALRITTSENWMKLATPEWVKRAGAKGIYYEYGRGRVEKSQTWDPVFDDPVYIEKLDRFLAAAAARYDGNPNVEFIDVGTYGMWGEGHTHMSSRQDGLELQKLHIDLHRKHFKKTLLCISDDFAGHDKPGRRFPITDYALSKGITIRDDSILVQPPPNSWYHAEMVQPFWPKMPVILEHEHYGSSIRRNAWDGGLLEKAVEDYRASFMSIHWWPREFLEANRDTIDRINRRMGYRLLPKEISWPDSVGIGERFTVQWNWVNKGVAPCYPGGFPALTLKDDTGGIVSVLVDESFNLRNLETGVADEAPVKKMESEFVVGLVAPVTKPGAYEVYVSVGARDGTPAIALPLKENDGTRRYRVGRIELVQKQPTGE